MKQWLIVGANRGLGNAFARGLPEQGDVAWLASRSRSALDGEHGVDYRWVDVDLRDPPQAALSVASHVGKMPLDVVIYNAGWWQPDDFRALSHASIIDSLNVNLGAALTIIHALQDNIVRAQGRIVLVGSTASLDNEGSRNVAYVAAKAGLRSAGGSFREMFRTLGVAVTCIIPGSIATDIPFDRGVDAALREHAGTRIPVQDLVCLTKCVLNLSPASCVKEIVIPALSDEDA